MKPIVLIIFMLLSKLAFCQVTFTVDNFSNEYYGKIFIADTSQVFSNGWVAIYDKKNQKQLIKVASDELTFTLHKGKVLANIKELPYGEQSQILYEDYNFDGAKDFAIMDGQFSCYHGPSFQIYLKTANGFTQNPGFTQLAQNYCGMFEVDAKSKTISTMTKSGCCWHEYSEFKVENNIPYPVKIVEEKMGASGVTFEFSETNRVNGKMVKTSFEKLAFDVEPQNLVLSFEFENQKKMSVFREENLLYYLFTDSEEKVELLCNDFFRYSKAKNNLTFSNRNTQYVVYDDKIIINTPKKTYEMKAAKNTRLGGLSALKTLTLENLAM